jgi:hypothetical protein
VTQVIKELSGLFRLDTAGYQRGMDFVLGMARIGHFPREFNVRRQDVMNHIRPCDLRNLVHDEGRVVGSAPVWRYYQAFWLLHVSMQVGQNARWYVGEFPDRDERLKPDNPCGPKASVLG